MKYIRLYWTHDRRDMPVWLISELDDENWETRKVEIWRGGAKGYADRANRIWFDGACPGAPAAVRRDSGASRV